MNPSDLLASIEAGNPPAVLDVRTNWEFDRGRVPGAIHIPFWTLLGRLSEISAYRETPMVVYCELGPRAWMAGTALRLCGFRGVQYLDGHMAHWRRHRLPQEK
jgi:hydroxyacylglutathione hydrolase